MSRRLCFVLLLVIGSCCVTTLKAEEEAEKEKAPEINVGERLFLETRFAQFFSVHATDFNRELASGDPVMSKTKHQGGDLPGPFVGKSMNCRACHLVDEHVKSPQGGMRTYADFAPRSPIPQRGDGKTLTLRNSPAQVNASVKRADMAFHFDGEFETMEDLVIGTMTGRNFGWLASEEQQARAQIAKVIRADNGQFPLSAESGGSYAKVFKGLDLDIPAKYRLPPQYRIDISKASDEQILQAVATLIAAYVTDLKFHQDDRGYNRSPYDVFLRKNNLPPAPAEGQSPLQYGRDLSARLGKLEHPEWVSGKDGSFKFHHQEFAFGEKELQGLKIFLREAPGGDDKQGVQPSGIGNCIACHQPPHFTDFAFHNTGVSQEEYDSIHHAGAFAAMHIPDEQERAALFAGDHSRRLENNPFADIPSLEHPGHTDLGLWNVFLNPQVPKPQAALMRIVKAQHAGVSSERDLLAATIAAFKTPGLRDLGHSAPYFHTGRFDDLTQAVGFYQRTSNLARDGLVRNADPQLANIHVGKSDVALLAAFLRSLNEDYE